MRRLSRLLSTGKPAPPKFGRDIAGEDSAAQGLHAMGAGRYEYIADFWRSLNRGPVKLEFGDKAPSLEELERAAVQERAMRHIQRSLMVGTFAAFAGCGLGWWITKKALGVKDIGEFGEAMGERLPKVSGSVEDSAVGRSLQATSETSRDSISESELLTTWRRSMRGKFNTEEGAEIARKNSMILAENRAAERAERAARKASAEKASAPKVAAVAPPADSPAVASPTTGATPAPAASLDEKPAAQSQIEMRVLDESEAKRLIRRPSTSWAGNTQMPPK